LLYVGCTKHLQHRLERHAKKEWWHDVTRIEETDFDDPTKAADAEEDYYFAEAPRYNSKKHTRYGLHQTKPPPERKARPPRVALEGLRTPQEIADYLKVDVRTVYRWLRSGEMDAIRFRQQYRISESALRKFVEERRTRRG
jgi:excisionase family DNA binding protein